MHDLKWLRANPDAFDAGMTARGLAPVAAQLIALDAKRRTAMTEKEEALARRNVASREIGARKQSGADAQDLIDEVATLKAKLSALEATEDAATGELDDLLVSLPNLPAADVPIGADEDANVEVRRHGVPPAFDFAPKAHDELGGAFETVGGLSGIDFAAAADLAGARFAVLSGPMARLERALGQFMIDVHTREHGFTEVAVPFLVRGSAMFGTGQLPKFGEDSFHTTDDRWLIPTSEVPLTNLVADRIVAEEALPLRLTALTPCFRSEAGAAGRDTRGMLRQHQFVKVEMVCITTPEQSDAEQERMTQCAETVLQRLDLPYRVVTLCTGDIGFGARRTFDIEVWVPAQGMYREISSVSTCGDFQARRMKARCRPHGAKDTRFVHTLNGSGVAVGRAMLALLENHQQADGSIRIPAALRPYLDGAETLVP